MRTTVRNTLLVFAAKKPVPQEIVDKYIWDLMIAIDAAKLGRATNRMCNVMQMHLTAGCTIWAKQKNRKKYEECKLGWNALLKAANRPTDTLDLTTGEYKQIRAAISNYVLALPKMEVGDLTYAINLAYGTMGLTESL